MTNENESDQRSKADWVFLNKKWRGYCKIGSIKVKGVPAWLINQGASLVALAGRFFRKRILGRT